MCKNRRILFAFIALTALLCIVAAACAVYPYTADHIRYAVKDTLPDGNGRAARVILLGGQSNAAGCSSVAYLKKNVTQEQYAAYEQGYDNVYIHYMTGQNTSDGFIPCAVGQGRLDEFFGPELGLAEALHEQYPDELFFIIKCAWGGTNLYEQWLSPSSEGKTGREYRSFVAFVQSSMDYLLSKGYDAKIEGMCWMQGESDSFMVETADAYGKHLENLIGDIRYTFAPYAAEDGIAFVDAYIAQNPAYWVYYEGVNRGKAEVAQLSPLNCVVDTSALTCDTEPEGMPDMAHYDSLSEIQLGHLFAQQLALYLG